MRKLILAAALLFGVHTATEAQDAKRERKDFRSATPEQRAQQQANRMEKALQLTAEQKKAIYELNLSTAKDMQSFKQEQQARKEKVRAIHQQREEKMKSILTSEQYAKLQQWKAERRKRADHHRAERRAKRPQGEILSAPANTK